VRGLPPLFGFDALRYDGGERLKVSLGVVFALELQSYVRTQTNISIRSFSFV
jgi:hypothetical protein